MQCFPGGAPELVPTGIGSLPHRSPEAALEVVRRHVPELPYWPQLPARDPREGMQRQFLDGLPGMISEEDLICSPEAALDGALPLYRAAMQGGDWVLPSPQRASCLHALTERAWPDARAVKGQIIGPVTLGLSLRDEEGIPLLHSAQMREILVRHLALSAAMQRRHLAGIGRGVILFVDEPYMSIYGSAQFSLAGREVLQMWREVARNLGCLLGIHCCGATDWSLVAGGPFDILSFDAFSYGDSLLSHSPDIVRFLAGGGILAWGIVPSDEQVFDHTAEDLADMWMQQAERLTGAARDLTTSDVARSSMLTPACGLGTLEIPVAEDIFRRLDEASDLLRSRFSFGGHDDGRGGGKFGEGEME